MSILLALSMAAASPPVDTVARARAFAMALLGPTAPRVMPYTTPGLQYGSWVSPVQKVKVTNSLAGFRKALSGCTLKRIVTPADGEDMMNTSIGIDFTCPSDAAHADGQVAMYVDFSKGRINRASLQFGFPPTMNSVPIGN